MRVLLVGSGGREHALAWALSRSPLLTQLFAAPGNPGIATLAQCVPIPVTDIAGLVAFARERGIDLVVPGPEAPLVAGLADALAAAGIACFGPFAAAARLEGSKAFAKDVAEAAGIPTARFERFDDPAAAHDFVRRRGAPIVVKADGLAGGKGVVVAQDLAEAEAAIDALLPAGRPGAVLVEECLQGDEVSLFALCDGTAAVLLGAAQDHKRIGDGDTGANTGGMGAVSPPTGFDRARQAAALDLFIRPALGEMARRGTPFRGVLFAGLMLTASGPVLIEYNVRLGDPEAQCLLPLLRGDLLAALAAGCRGGLAAAVVELADVASVAVVVAARGYPALPAVGGAIDVAAAEAVPGVQLFHSGTAVRDGALVAAGGRVLSVCATGATLGEARDSAYAGVAALGYADGIWRRDIGVRALQATPARGNGA